MSEEQPPSRRRRHRRVIAPATHAAPEDAPDFTEPRLDVGEGPDQPDSTAPQTVGSDEWWRSQRPPHWG